MAPKEDKNLPSAQSEALPGWLLLASQLGEQGWLDIPSGWSAPQIEWGSSFFIFSLTQFFNVRAAKKVRPHSHALWHSPIHVALKMDAVMETKGKRSAVTSCSFNLKIAIVLFTLFIPNFLIYSMRTWVGEEVRSRSFWRKSKPMVTSKVLIRQRIASRTISLQSCLYLKWARSKCKDYQFDEWMCISTNSNFRRQSSLYVVFFHSIHEKTSTRSSS